MIYSVCVTGANRWRITGGWGGVSRVHAQLTSQHHPAEHRVVPVQRAAVPAVMSELVLALPDPLLGSLADGLHQVRVALAQLTLLVDQAGNVVADDAGTQRSDVPEVDRSTKTGNRGELVTKIPLRHLLEGVARVQVYNNVLVAVDANVSNLE